MTQPAFAQFVGCSAPTIQRIENRTLKMSAMLADKILEATGANPAKLRAGKAALDVNGKPYTKQSFEDYRKKRQEFHYSIDYYGPHLSRYLSLLLIASERAGQDKLHAVVAAMMNSFGRLADDFDLKKNIDGFLIEQGHVRKRTYLVRDLRKFRDYADLVGFKDNKRFKPSKRIPFVIPDGWIPEFDQLIENPIFPKEIARKFRDKDYIIAFDRPIPDTPEFNGIKEALLQVSYWRIKKFKLKLSD